jgi:hypothetical protein
MQRTLLLFLAMAIAALAQTANTPADETFTLDMTPVVVKTTDIFNGGVADSDCSINGTDLSKLDEGAVRTTIEKILYQVDPKKKRALDDSTYYIVHILRHKAGTIGTECERWYTYFKGWAEPPSTAPLTDPGIRNYYREAHLMGARSITFLYLHLDTPVNTYTDFETASKNSSLKDKDARELWTSFSNNLRTNRTLHPTLRGAGGCKLVPFSPSAELQYAVCESLLPIIYRISITKKTPTNIANLASLAKGIAMGGGENETIRLQAAENYSLIAVKSLVRIDYPASLINIEGMRGESDEPQSISKKEYTNERKTRWDVSLSMPIRGIEDLKLEGDNLIPKKIERRDVFATANFFPLPVDISRMRWRFLPQLMYGVNITGRPLDRQLFAAGIGSSVVQPFVGVTRTNVTVKIPDQTTTGKDVKWQMVWGINLSVKRAFERIAGK